MQVDDHPLRRWLDALPAWHQDAPCNNVGTAVFFPEKGQTYDEARAICAECDYAAACLAEGLEPDNLNYGMRGGFTPAERRALKHSRSPGEGRIAGGADPPATLNPAPLSGGGHPETNGGQS